MNSIKKLAVAIAAPLLAVGLVAGVAGAASADGHAGQVSPKNWLCC